MRSFKYIFVIIHIFTLLPNLHARTPDPVFAENGMVVSTSRQASEAGVEILKKGGNAVDAAVAVGFALAVTSSSNGNIGGGGFMIGVSDKGERFTLDHREKAPDAAHRDMFLDDKGNVVPNMSLYTRAGSGVPGTVSGLLKAWADHGSGNITRYQVLAPAIRLAGKGFILSYYEAERFNNNRELFQSNDAAAKIFIRKDGRPWKKGDRFVQNDLAKTLKRIAKFGQEGFYNGPVADMIIEEMKRGNGLITHEDLKNYNSVYREPVRGTFHNIEILSMGPPSSGGLLLIQMLNMLENFRLDTMGWNSADYIHLLTEIERRAYADRAEHLGDEDFWDVPAEMLVSKNYAKARISDISMNKATPSKDVFSGPLAGYESPETTHYSVVDKNGYAVAVTTTINLGYGGGHLVAGAGFFLNNEMDDFSIKPGFPNAYGLVGNEANAIRGAKRPLSSMSPTILLFDDEPLMTIGTPGGSTIITTVLQCIINVVLHRMDIKEAVCSPRVHHQWLPPDTIHIEPRSIPKDVINILESRGHIITPYGGGSSKQGYIGEANGIMITEDGLYGAGDCRGETSAIGY